MAGLAKAPIAGLMEIFYTIMGDNHLPRRLAKATTRSLTPDTYNIAKTSITEIAANLHVLPITVINKELKTYEYLEDILDLTHDIFTGYYLQAMAIIGSIKAIHINSMTQEQFEQIRQDKEPQRRLVRNYTSRSVGNAASSFDLLEYDEEDLIITKLPTIDQPVGFGIEEDKEENKKEAKIKTIKTVDYDKSITEKFNKHALGRVVDVTISSYDRMVKIPIFIRLAVKFADDEVVRYLLDMGKTHAGFKTRWEGWRLKEHSFINLITGLDMIKNYKQLAVLDKANVYREIVEQYNKSVKKKIFTGRSDIRALNNILIITEEDQKYIERKLVGSFEKKRFRDKFFRDNLLTMILVVDREWDMLNIYYRGVEQYTQLSVKQLKSGKKNNEATIIDFVKAFTQSSRLPI